ncbi:Enoyl-CoA hydratase / Delta-cis-delta(2)-trans-enoyl-CoA isomerase / 3-hydroxyacyl-CoA dehydrogenase [Roseibacterium elongatum DSM 19469]|uniref:Enoyl-CoA hydratase / Delta-cis-delta(2)-trans-enoyl-CoA isomerase / 3-hydroxyacyl-CoA dehydrogenase n=1 Tax=Roseicyclus elongatus DSM 19469 TaxID=1294273 RepID=W8S3C4_9RHOB|nr:3-hydroxyacyl-CoA dehydrogenase NAD-binding domain-containing protein [Roseibacterium elongatum]AHM04712.1 Enoyl-CoA hydratase / Delta-cis-delta(2)-trans-enoyl-CoA isomerase / 3-hydroxyacyl-CoA dehydrogenase [Roseibacterium elongatum DSM 19469]
MVVSIAREGEIAVITVDNPPVNALGHALRQGLWDAAETLDADPGIRAVVLICAGRTFIAGADVTEFGKPPVPPHLPDLVARIETAAKPWVAAIHGSALGGGFEVALGCRFRVAVADASVGLPEVTLGIVPGAGGTVRTPRLVGAEQAVAMVTTGKPVKAPKALSLGLIDTVIEGDLRAGAVAFAREAIEAPLPAPLCDRPASAPPEGFWAAQDTTVAKAARGAAAPLRALACVKRAVTGDFADALAFERETFLDLRGSDQAAALRHVFFAERAAPRPKSLKGVVPRPVATAAVIGGGTMGAGIAAALRNAGLPVVMVERDDDALERGLANLGGIFDGAVKRGRLTPEGRADRMAGVTATTDYGGLADVDLVIEAVFEEISVKRAVFAQLGAVCRPDAVLATNTSYLDPRDIAVGLLNPDRFIGLHFFSPAHVMKLLEIVPTPDTAPEVLANGFALAKRLGKMPVQAGICDGFIGNRILKHYRAAAEDLVRAGVPIAEIDAAMRGFGMAMGPFQAQDLGGLDIAYLQREGARARGEDVPPTLGDILVRAGRKGQKSGGGWYDYTPGNRTPQPSDAVAELLAGEIHPGPEMDRDAVARRLVAEMAEEAAAILAEGVATQPSDIDLVKIHGYGFPRWRGGPMFHAMQRGAEGLTQDLGRSPSDALMAVLGQD